MILLDTNFLIYALRRATPQGDLLRQWIQNGESVRISALVWAEFLCGPVSEEDRQAAAALLPNPEPLLAEDGLLSAVLYNATGRRRGSLVDCMIAATSIRLGARLATENISHFQGFQAMGLQVVTSA